MFITSILTDSDEVLFKTGIERHDIWDVGFTLANVIVPLLQAFKEHGQSYGFVDDSDAPPALATGNITIWDESSFWQLKWNWMLDEMIWAFETIATGDWNKEDRRVGNALRLFAKYYGDLWS